jgi:hypothetical protein
VTLNIANRSSVTRALPQGVSFHVRRSDNTSFFVFDYEPLAPPDSRPTTVRGQSSAVYVFPAGLSLRAPSWFMDDRVTIPGTYELTAIFSDTDPRQLHSTDLRLVAERTNGLVSSSVPMIVEKPFGDDAAVCTIARNLTQGDAGTCPTWALYGAAEPVSVIWRDYRRSTYARYLAGVIPGTTEERLSRIREVISKEPDTEFADWRRLELAKVEEYASFQALNRKDAKAGADHTAAAVSLYRQVANSGRSAEVRKRASDMADDLMAIIESRAAEERSRH